MQRTGRGAAGGAAKPVASSGSQLKLKDSILRGEVDSVLAALQGSVQYLSLAWYSFLQLSSRTPIHAVVDFAFRIVNMCISMVIVCTHKAVLSEFAL